MKLQTRLFGEIEYAQEDVITFPQGLPCFESERAFLLLPIEGSESSILCLQSVSTPALSFVMMNPFFLDPNYVPALKPQERELLQVERDQDLCFYVLCAMKRPVSSSTLNFKCPIAINPDLSVGCQVILDTDAYHMRHPLSEFARNKEGDSC